MEIRRPKLRSLAMDNVDCDVGVMVFSHQSKTTTRQMLNLCRRLALV